MKVISIPVRKPRYKIFGKLTDNVLVDDADYEYLKNFKIWISANGYPVTKFEGKEVRLSRLLLSPIPEGKEVDHIDRDILNTQRSNLRVATRSQNNANNSKRTGTTSIYKGVYFNKFASKWHAQITKDNRPIHLGYFNTEIEAARARDKVALELFGEFANLNLA